METASDASPRLIAVTIDCNDLEATAGFWTQLFDMTATVEEPFAFLTQPEGRKLGIWLQRVPEAKAGKNRVHLDFVVADLEAAERRVVELGGSLGDRQSWQSYIWRICHDPEGNEFDIMQAPQQT